MHIPNSTAREILKAMPMKQRQQIADLMTGNIVKEVHCQSDTCKGRLMGHLYQNGKFRGVVDEEGKMWCRASRYRLDGFLGFQCWCGNDSRLAPQEVGNKGIKQGNASKSDLESVWERVSHKPSNYPINGKNQEIDGFLIVEVT